MNRLLIHTLIPAIYLGASLAACAPAAVPVVGSERDAVLAFSEPKTDVQLSALASGDYTAFIKDYDDAMIKATTESSFIQLRAVLSSKVGAYQSREITSVLQQGSFYIVIDSAKFDRDDQVTMRVVFETEGDHKIAGLWFDSPKLRQ